MNDDTYWYYWSDFGMFMILPKAPGDYSLWIDDNYIGDYPSANDAADYVYLHLTGCKEWDHIPDTDPPTGLDGWTRGLYQ